MRTVSQNGGTATYLGIGASNPSGHHTPRFDIDEAALTIGVSILSTSVLELLA
ncbi:M20 family metallo-hydrolase [Halalkalicoccus subterraneus]|uniref:M20 family metallo-hydrolase n=1 Tax=Halalkalicoccus subterraneus TaxID=2675002 RepID=UPI0013CE77C0|nr:M20 family metallo-hydrolase [Halalkalicoccus subterraneus]